jgi:hypothetical protein
VTRGVTVEVSDVTSIEPSPLSTPARARDDLRARLRATRWPDAAADAGWSLGVDLEGLRGLVEYWAGGTNGSSMRMYGANQPPRAIARSTGRAQARP